VVTANLRVGDHLTSATLGKALLTAAAPPVAKICVNCGTVEAVNIIEVKGDGNYLGTIGGGLIGGLLGNQVGGGSGKKVATVAGVIGGALAGHTIEGNVKKIRALRSAGTPGKRWNPDSHFRSRSRLPNRRQGQDQ
jgi:outer membrane lipoprotein SlyB